MKKMVLGLVLFATSLCVYAHDFEGAVSVDYEKIVMTDDSIDQYSVLRHYYRMYGIRKSLVDSTSCEENNRENPQMYIEDQVYWGTYAGDKLVEERLNRDTYPGLTILDSYATTISTNINLWCRNAHGETPESIIQHNTSRSDSFAIFSFQQADYLQTR